LTHIVQPNATTIAEAVQRLRGGQPVAFPTETVYGLGADARRVDAVEAVYRMKGRPADHPLIVHVADPDDVHAWVSQVPSEAERLIETFWPGPLTLVLPRAAGVPGAVTAGQATVAVRMPEHPVALELIRSFGGGLVAPSANRYGFTSPSRAEHVHDEFKDSDLLILDGGACDVGIESTIVDLSGAEPAVLRPGRVSVQVLQEALGVDVAAGPVATGTVAAGTLAAARPRVSGDRARHYAPSTPTVLKSADAISSVNLGRADVFVVARTLKPGANEMERWAQLPPDPEGYARGLYAALRTADRAGCSKIWVEQPPSSPAWWAVNDRLKRATAPRDAGEGLT
jgi:L-threonylcarbamoyladenylate synthase